MPVLAYGSFITVAINFIIFKMVRVMNKMKRAEPEAAPGAAPGAAPEAPPADIALLTEIRDALKKK